MPFDDPATFSLISQSKTLGCFQIESPGQRELVGKSGLETFEDIIIDISLFRPGPVKSDMITPYLEARQGWSMPTYLHDDLRPILEETYGVVVFHEQVIEIIAQFTGCTLAEADEARRALGDVEGMADTRLWFFPRAVARGYPPAVVEEVWKVLEAFGSFGFCKAHAAAFALPTYQSAWLKTHHPAHFLAGVLTHDPGMYPKRLILDDARQFGIAVLGLDVNASDAEYVVEKVGVYDEPPPEVLGQPPRQAPGEGLPDGRAYGIRLALAEVKGISEAEVGRDRRGPSLPVAHRLLAPRPRLPAGRGAARAGRRVRLDLRDRLAGRGAPPRQGDPARPAPPGRRPRPVRAGGRPGGQGPQPRAVPHPPRRPGRAHSAARRPGGRPRGGRVHRRGPGGRGGAPEQLRPPGPRAGRGAGRLGAGRRPVPGDPAPRPRSPRSSSPSTSATPRRRRRGQRAAGDERLRAGPRRARDPRPRRQPARHGLLHRVPRRARRGPVP